MDIFLQNRKSYITIGEIYFWTATIHKWKHLMKDDGYKEIVVESLRFLSGKGKVDVFGFVIMDNHLHFIWRINELNGKETSQASFLKFTAHKFKEKLRKETPDLLKDFKVEAVNKNYEFWQRDSLAVHLSTKEMAYQKLDYIHNNPLAEHWKLVTDPCDYKYSSASFYERGTSIFTFIKDLRNEY